jgi:hypothetical protein
MIGAVPHFAPSGRPHAGQNTETDFSLESQLTSPSACTDRVPAGADHPLVLVDPGDPIVPEEWEYPAGPFVP